MSLEARLRSPSLTRAPEPRLAVAAPAYVVSLGLGAASVAASASSMLFSRLLDGVPVTDGNLRGTAFVVMLIGVPLLLTGMALAARGSLRGLVLWLGAAAYLTYQGVMFCFGTPMNEFFLSYVAMLGTGVWTLVVVLATVDPGGIPSRVQAGMPYRTAGGLLGTFAALNGLAWLARILPPLLDGDPAGAVAGTGLPTSPAYVQDLAVWIPAALVSAGLIWSRSPRGVLLTLSMLTFYVVECLSVASDQWFGVRADDSHPELASLSMVPGALALAAVTAAVVLWSLKHLARAPRGLVE